MKLATTTGDFGRYTKDQLEATSWISQSGFRYIDYNFHTDYCCKNGVLGENPQRYMDDLKRHAEELGVIFAQAHAPIGNPFLQDGGELTEATILSVKACAELGIKDLVIHSAYAPGLSKAETIEKNKEFYMPILREAEQYGVCILTENLYKMTDPNVFWIDNAKDLLTLIEYVDHPLFHAVWDTGHANMQDTPQDESLRLLGKHVRGLHVNDNFGDADLHIPPYFGTMNFDSLMQGLFNIGYDGYFTFEGFNFFGESHHQRRKYEKDTRLAHPHLNVRKKAEELLYEIGKNILSEYHCFEE